METSRTIVVSALDATHRRAIEDVIGLQLRSNQRIVIGVEDACAPGADDRAPPPTLEDWQSLYQGLSAEQIEQIDRIINTRADLTRFLNLP